VTSAVGELVEKATADDNASTGVATKPRPKS
jgi:hypothetical protein